jgi:CspA family cold shock protein
LKGVVKRWLGHRGFGFIDSEEEDGDVFIHHSEIQGAYDLREGQEVEFEVESTYKGPRAVNLKIVE